MANFPLFKFGSEKDMTCKTSTVGFQKLRFLKVCVESGCGQEATKCQGDVYFFSRVLKCKIMMCVWLLMRLFVNFIVAHPVLLWLKRDLPKYKCSENVDTVYIYIYIYI